MNAAWLIHVDGQSAIAAIVIFKSRSSQSPKTWSSLRNSDFTMELQVCAILSHTHQCFVPFAPPPLLSSEPTFSVLENLKVLKTCMFDCKKRRNNTQGHSWAQLPLIR